MQSYPYRFCQVCGDPSLTQMTKRMKEEEDLLNDVYHEPKDIDDTFEVELNKYEQPF